MSDQIAAPIGKVPSAVSSAVSDGSWNELTVNRLGKRVHRISGRSDGPERILKIQPAAAKRAGVPTLEDERDRLQWLGARLRAPEVIACETNDDDTTFLVTEFIDGTAGDDMLNRLDSDRTLAAFATTLATLHAVPINDCPFDSRNAIRLADAEARVQSGLVRPEHLDVAYRQQSPERLLAVLHDTLPDTEELVVTHGAYSLDNVMLNDGEVVGMLDVGRLGVADRHADLALAARSITRQLGPDAVGRFMIAYGLEWPDSRKIDFYLLLRELF